MKPRVAYDDDFMGLSPVKWCAGWTLCTVWTSLNHASYAAAWSRCAAPTRLHGPSPTPPIGPPVLRFRRQQKDPAGPGPCRFHRADS